MTMCLKHLADQDTYRKLDENTTKETANKVVSILRGMYQDGIIDQKVAEYLLSTNPVRTQDMYFLTKIDKNPYSERPIVSRCNGPTECLFLHDHWLQPLAQALPSYIKDSKSFIKIIEPTPLPNDCILCTLDESSLYTNIPTEEGMSIALRAVRNEACLPLSISLGYPLFCTTMCLGLMMGFTYSYKGLLWVPRWPQPMPISLWVSYNQECYLQQTLPPSSGRGTSMTYSWSGLTPKRAFSSSLISSMASTPRLGSHQKCPPQRSTSWTCVCIKDRDLKVKAYLI